MDREPGTEAVPGAEPAAAGPAEAAEADRAAGPRSPIMWYVSGRSYALTRWRAVVAAREHSDLVDTGFTVYERDVSVAGSLLAGALAYRLFLWLLPAALVLVGGLGFASKDQVDEAAHDAGLGGVVTDGVGAAAEQAHHSRWWLLILGVYLLYFATRQVVKALRVANRLAYGTGGMRERASPRAVLAVVGVVLLVALVHVVAVAVRRHGLVLSVGVLVVMTVVWSAIWWGISMLLPHGEATPLYLVPGAVVVGVGTQGLYAATALYFAHKITSASQLYGALGGAATLLLWLFVFARLVLGSAELSAVLWERRSLDPWIARFGRVLAWAHLS